MDLATRLDLFQTGRQFFRQRTTSIDPAQVDILGSDANLIVGGQSVMAAKVVQQVAYQSGRHFVAGCFDEDLDRYAYDKCFGLLRKGASPAVSQVRFFRAGGASGSIPAGTVLRTVGGQVEHVMVTPAVFSSGGLSATCFTRATQAGKSSQTGANTIRTFANPTAIFDQTIQLTNDVATAGGEDREDDDTFKGRIIQFPQSLAKGTNPAIQFGALTVPGVVSALAQDAVDPSGNSARVVNLFIADSTGVANAALVANVVSVLPEYKAGGIAVVLFTSIPQILSIVTALQFSGNVDTVSLTAAVWNALVEFVNTLPVNAPLYRSDLLAVVRRFKPLGVVPWGGSIVSPAGDVFPTLGQTIRTSLAYVSAAS